MKLLSEKIVDATWAEAWAGSRDQRNAGLSDLLQGQPHLHTFVTDTTSRLAPGWTDDALFVTQVLWRMFERLGGPLPTIAPADIERSIQHNTRVLSELRAPQRSGGPSAEDVSQPYVMQRLLAFLYPDVMAGRTRRSADDDRGLLFFVLKTVLDALDRAGDAPPRVVARERSDAAMGRRRPELLAMELVNSGSQAPLPLLTEILEMGRGMEEALIDLVQRDELRFSSSPSDVHAWYQGVDLLGRVGGEGAALVLLGLVDGPEEILDLLVPLGLGRLGRCALPHLREALGDPERALREKLRLLAALACLAACHPECAVSADRMMRRVALGMPVGHEAEVLSRYAASLLAGLSGLVPGALPPPMMDEDPLPLPNAMKDGFFVPADALLTLARTAPLGRFADAETTNPGSPTDPS